MPHNVSHVTTATGCCWVRFDDTFYQAAVFTSIVADGRVRAVERFALCLDACKGWLVLPLLAKSSGSRTKNPRYHRIIADIP